MAPSAQVQISDTSAGARDTRGVDFDLVVMGASGYTGRLVVEYLLNSYPLKPNGEGLRWAVAGRSRDKVQTVLNEVFQKVSKLSTAGEGEKGGKETTDTAPEIMVADSHDISSLERMVRRTKVVCSTVGPYAQYGSLLVEACAKNGVHYCDLTAEGPWMLEMIAKHQKTAEQTGAKIVFSCGVDSVPSDLLNLLATEAMLKKYGTLPSEVKVASVALETAGGFSGGTMASVVFTDTNPWVEPYGLTPPGSKTGEEKDKYTMGYDKDFKSYTGHFVMAPANTRIVRRSNALVGRFIKYDETMVLGGGVGGFLFGAIYTFILFTFGLLVHFKPTRALVQKVAPAQGEGPSESVLNSGKFKFLVIAKGGESGQEVRGSVTSSTDDPGYKGTAKMLTESGISLAMGASNLPERCGGFWTPATVMGLALVDRLNAAGHKYVVE